MSAKQEYHISQKEFSSYRYNFVKYLDDIESFLDEALAKGLLSEEHRSVIMTHRNPDEQHRCLYGFLYPKLPYASDELMLALKNSNQNRISILFDKSAYPMKFKPHGRVILINNVKFDDEEKHQERFGSEKDVEGITKLFTDFNFDVQLYSNKTAEEMKAIIEKASKESTAREDCFVMFLMSHGVIGNIVGTDGEKLSYSTIKTILRDSSQLKNKPKLIYVNACRVTYEKKAEEGYSNVPDLFVTYATIAERQAYRTDVRGSIFIKCLLTVYEKNKKECNIVSLSPEINEQVSKESNEISENQVSIVYSTLKKQVILRAKD
ncbi:caspase-7 [Octopus bimaculoides]|uniref:Caspase family p20 domain-containing protein n=1 Tax=Octopus bimaculoides TaxID=37653 RepID=A0A0L8FH12_OCTBM|nr:caspase-7 [Octopus bimaculoides]|eukprot:XP_014790088.1 PREDICTED: caspase-7-like [Octopus bimaculoides]